MLGGYNVNANEPGLQPYIIRCEGGSSAISKFKGGAGITVSRTGTGAYRLTFADSPGEFVGATLSLGAATPGDVAGHTAIHDEWDSTNLRLDFVVYNASDAAHDLAADEYVTVVAWFKRHGVSGS